MTTYWYNYDTVPSNRLAVIAGRSPAGRCPVIADLRARVPHEEFDYLALMAGLRGYARPRDRVTTLLRQRVIIRVKKGLYIFGPTYRRAPYSREVLANLISGPSCISLEYALSYYGLIPERVETVTSATTGKRRAFDTPVGRFTYWPVPERVFSMGIERVETGDGRAFLIAGRERAICDVVMHRRGLEIRTPGQLGTWLADDLRVDTDGFAALDAALVSDIADAWRSARLRLLAQLLSISRDAR